MATATTMSAAALRASVPARLRELLNGPMLHGTLLARFPTALYVAVPAGFGVIALVTRDAVRLPCALVLPASSREFPLDRPGGPLRIGAGALRIGGLEVVAGRVVSVAVPNLPAPAPNLLRDFAPVEFGDPVRLLGRGDGLTPSGDDILGGYLAAAASFGLPANDVRSIVEAECARRTTTLSAALLRHAAAGEAIPQVVALLDALCGRRPLPAALDDLRRVGHSSGAALTAGVLVAARRAAAAVAA
jgi:hypothetical protein